MASSKKLNKALPPILSLTLEDTLPNGNGSSSFAAPSYCLCHVHGGSFINVSTNLSNGRVADVSSSSMVLTNEYSGCGSCSSCHVGSDLLLSPTFYSQS